MRMTKSKVLIMLILVMALYNSQILSSNYSPHTILAGPNMTKDFTESAVTWYNSSWTFRRAIDISGSFGAGTDYQVKLTIIYNASLLPDFADIRFTSADKLTELSYWVEGYTYAGSATVWVKVTDDLASDTTIYLYYGNKDATSESSGTNTFLFFDDFDDGALNATKWHTWTGGGTPAEADGIFSLTTSSGWASYGSYERFGENVALGMLAKVTTETTFWVLGLDERTYDGTASGGVDWCGVNNNGGTRCYTSSDGTISNVARSTAYTTYQKVEVQRLSDKVKFYEGQGVVLKATITSHLPVDDLGVTILNQNARVEYWDYVYVRNCIDTEPVVGTFGEEENTMNLHPWPSGTWVQNATYVIDETLGTNEPCVLYEGNPQILTNEETVFKMWYRVGWTSGTISIYYAESVDGYTWAKYAGNPVISAGDHYCPFVLHHDGYYYLWASDGPWTGDTLYNSTDGITWQVMNGGAQVISITTGDAWDNVSIGNVAVIIDETGTWNMIYEAYGTGGLWKLGLATSTNGTTWTKYAGNPVLSRNGSCGGPDIIYLSGTYFVFFHSAESGSLPTEIYMTSTKDFVHYAEPVHVMGRAYDWEGVGDSNGQVADPDVLFADGEIIMFYTGVSAQSVGNQQIGIALLSSEIDSWALDMGLIFLGLFMIPASTIYMAKGGLKEASMDKVAITLVVFILGWAFFIGGIFT